MTSSLFMNEETPTQVVGDRPKVTQLRSGRGGIELRPLRAGPMFLWYYHNLKFKHNNTCNSMLVCFFF